MTSILVIEDEVNIRHFIVANLRIRGFEVIEAGDAETGLSIMQHDNPRLVLLDVRLPGMSGLDLLSVLNGHAKNLPIVLMSAYPLSPADIQPHHPNVKHVLSKPLDARALLSIIRELLGSDTPENLH